MPNSFGGIPLQAIHKYSIPPSEGCQPPSEGFHIINSEVFIPYTLSIEIFLLLNEQQRQPKRTMCGFGLQRLFGRNILELLVYYLMPNKCKNVKDMKSSCLSICTSSL